jgi:DNA-binding beta-propeller fold protein YncE
MRALQALILILAFGAQADVVVASNRGGGTVTIIDPASMTVLGTVDAAPEPHEVAISADGRRAYATNYAHATGTTLTVIDLDSATREGTIELGLVAPHGIVERHGKLYFTAEQSGAVGRYDPLTARVDWIGRPQAQVSHMLAVSQDGTTAFTANILSGSLSIIPVAAEGETSARKQIATVPFSESIALSPDGREVWTGSVQTGGIAIVDLATESVVARIAQGLSAYRLAFTPDGRYVLAPRGNTIVVYDAVLRTQERTIAFAGQPLGVIAPAGSNYAYVSTANPNRVEKLDLNTWTSAGFAPAGAIPDGLAYRVGDAEPRPKRRSARH